MLYLSAEFLTRFVSGFNLFTYITMRAIMAALTSLIISLLLGPGLIRWLQRKKIGQTVREDGPGTHLTKAGTPTMGGTLMLLAIGAGTLLWGNPRSPYLWIVLGVTLAYGAIGFVDDYRKLTRRNPKGLSARAKFAWQALIALAAAAFLYWLADRPQETALLFPFLKNGQLFKGAPGPWTFRMLFNDFVVIHFRGGPFLLLGVKFGYLERFLRFPFLEFMNRFLGFLNQFAFRMLPDES